MIAEFHKKAHKCLYIENRPLIHINHLSMRVMKVAYFLQLIGFSLLFSILWPINADAQFFRFGKNRVQYEDFEWRYIQTEHFDIYYYSDKNYDLARFAADYLEPSLQQLRQDFDHEINDRIKVIIYDSHNDFDQTNVIPLPIDTEGIGGVTDKYKNRMTIPFQGDYADFATTIHHELVHAVVNDMFYGGNIQSIISNNIQLVIPLWFEEGLAEYTSNGWDTNTDMFIRDAIINNWLPSIPQMNGYVSYRGGQAMWNYIVEEYGRAKIPEVMQQLKTLRSIPAAFQASFGMTIEEFSERMMNSLKRRYLPEIANRQNLNEIATQVTKRGEFGTYNTSPVISPAGDKIAMITNSGNQFNVVVASTVNGRRLKTVIKGSNNAEFEELNILDPNLTWSPDGRFLALSAKSRGKDDLAIVNYETGKVTKVRLEELDAIGSVSWSPDGSKIAFDANSGGYQDIYIYDLNAKTFSNVTQDLFTDSDPSWSADSQYLLFSSNRGQFVELNTYKKDYVYFTNQDLFQMDLYRMRIGDKEAERLTNTPDWEETNPNGLLNGDIVYISDKNGIPNIFQLNPENGVYKPLTDLQVGIRQLSVSLDGSRLAVNTYNEGYLDIFLIKAPLLKERSEPLEDSYWALRRKREKETKRVPAMGHVFEDYATVSPLGDKITGVDSTIADQVVSIAEKQKEDEAAKKAEEAKEEEDIDVNNLDFRNYVFSDEVLEDSVIVAMEVDVFNPEQVRNEDGQYLPRPYRLTFSPDISYASSQLSTFGAFGLAQFTYSDLLGDHQISFITNMQLDLRNSDYAVQYAYLKNRWNFSTNFFHTSRQFQNFNGQLFRLRNFGGGLAASYPFDKFRRVELNASVIGFSTDISNAFASGVRPENRNASFFLPSATYTVDRTIPGFLTPVGGSRSAISFQASPPIPGTDVIRFGMLTADYRKYINLGYTYSIALRASGGLSFGPESQSFFMGGVMNWLNLQWRDNQIPLDRLESTFFTIPAMPMRGHLLNSVYGNKFSLFNAEFRFPLVAALLPGPIPFLALYNLRGVAFADIGASWGFSRQFTFEERLSFNDGTFREVIIPIDEAPASFDARLNQSTDLLVRYDYTNPSDFEVVENINEFTLPAPGEDNTILQRQTRVDQGSILAGAGFGLRTILFGFPVRWDIAWPYNRDGFGERINYFSIGVDF